VQSQIEIITPATAKAILLANGRNRPLSERTVQRYTDDIRNNRWKQNGATIVIATNGDLIDGQHRLSSVVRANKAVAFLVVRNVEAEAFDTIDNGKGRSCMDILSIAGYEHAKTVSTASRVAYIYASGANFASAPGRVVLTNFAAAHPYIVELAAQVERVRRFPRGPLAAVLLLANETRSMDEEVETFVEGISTGERLERSDPRLTLREWAVSERDRFRGVIRARSVFPAIIRAWNAYASGKPLTVIKSLGATNRYDMPIFGFDRMAFADVLDVRNDALTPQKRVAGRFISAREGLSA